MLKREEKKLAEYNLGKLKGQKLTLQNFVKLEFAYIDKKRESAATVNFSGNDSTYRK